VSRRKLISLIFIVLFLLQLSAQEIMFETFDSGVDVWMLFPYDTFHFGKDDSLSVYQVSTQIKNQHGTQVANNEIQIEVLNRDWLKGTAIPITQTYQLSTGSHSISISLRNKKLGDKQNYSRKFNVGSVSTELGQAYIIACREGFDYIPESMDLKQLDSLTLRHRFAIGAGNLSLVLDGIKHDFKNPTSPFELNLKEIAPQDSISTLVIFVDEMNIRYKLEPLIYQAWFSYNQRYSPKDQLEQLRYIANQNEWKVLRKIPESKYHDAIESFWQANDPSPGTLRNENREFFYHRILQADEQFTIHKRMPGWKSDRGRIYIKFGDPDQIVGDAFPIGKPSSITWHYFRFNRSFIFTDERGFGQYTLRNKEDEYIDY